jgi:acetyl esterase
MALDEATAVFVARTESAWGRPLHQMSVAEARALGQHTDGGDHPGIPSGIASVRDALVTSVGGSIAVRVFAPEADPRGVMVFYHSGGWALGGASESAAFAAAVAARTGCAVVCPGYRLAPEYRYPTAVQDAWAALEWAASSASDIAGARVPLIVAGDGAGGALAAVVARWSFERGGPAVDAQILLCPVTDADFGSLSCTDPANQLLVGRETMMWFWDMYAPDVAARRHPDASPLEAVFLTGVPPAVIVTAEHDVVRDGGELYAMRLVQAGVPVEHRRFAGQMHGFTGVLSLPGSAEGLDFVAKALDRTIRQGEGVGDGLDDGQAEGSSAGGFSWHSA